MCILVGGRRLRFALGLVRVTCSKLLLSSTVTCENITVNLSLLRSLVLRGFRNSDYLVKDFVLRSVDAVSQGFNPSLLLHRSLSLELHIRDLKQSVR